MNSLDKIWLRMLIGGIIMLAGYTLLTFYESASGSRIAFNEEIIPFSTTTLLDESVIQHIRSDSRFNTFLQQQAITSSTNNELLEIE